MCGRPVEGAGTSIYVHLESLSCGTCHILICPARLLDSFDLRRGRICYGLWTFVCDGVGLFVYLMVPASRGLKAYSQSCISLSFKA